MRPVSSLLFGIAVSAPFAVPLSSCDTEGESFPGHAAGAGMGVEIGGVVPDDLPDIVLSVAGRRGGDGDGVPKDYTAQTFTVTTTADSGAGSLRQALTSCNGAGGHCTIVFDIPTTDAGYDAARGVWTIAYLDTPPSITVPDVLLDGTTQTAAQGDTNPSGPEIVLSGEDHTVEFAFSAINAPNLAVVGFSIVEFLYGIQIYGEGSTSPRIQGNYLGVDADGVTGRGNYNGLELLSGASGAIVGGAAEGERNVVAGNLHVGIRISDANDNEILGNYVGVDRTGAVALPNYDGVSVEGRSESNVIGGPGVGEGNVTSGNVAYGIDIFGAGAKYNEIYGNLIGTDVTGTYAIPNTYGILFDDRSSFNIVGGYEPGEGNLISGNTAFGAYFYNNGTNSNELRGNLIGTDAAGSSAIPNETGVWIDGGTYSNVIDGNVISGNVVGGMTIFSIESDENVVTRNLIGTDSSGTAPLGNGIDGIRIAHGPKSNVIGGSAESGNVIAHNGKHGVAIESLDAAFNRISCNAIFGNGELGIELFPEGPNANDAGDADTGANYGMNTPVIDSVTAGAGGSVVSGTIDTYDAEDVAIEIFDAEITPAGFLEGVKYLGSAAPDASGVWSTTVSVADAALVTATATDSFGNTSEFSQ